MSSTRSEEEVERHPNHVILAAEPKLVVGQFKTSKDRAPIVEVLHLGLLEVVLETLGRHPRRHLFENAKGKPFTREGFSKWTIAFFGRGASSATPSALTWTSTCSRWPNETRSPNVWSSIVS